MAWAALAYDRFRGGQRAGPVNVALAGPGKDLSVGLKRILGGNRRPEPAEAPSQGSAAELLAKLALLDYGGFNANIVPW